jgi:hypothetical protein
MMRLVPTSVFIQQKINPFPGLQVTVNNSVGVIRSVSGGRTLVDFNHPYSGHDLVYDVEIIRKVDDDLEKLKSFFDLHFNMSPDIKIEEGIAKIPLDLPDIIAKGLSENLKKIIPTIKSFEFKQPEAKKPEKKEAPEKKPKKPVSDTAQE